jgi:hypothetical protein
MSGDEYFSENNSDDLGYEMFTLEIGSPPVKIDFVGSSLMDPHPCFTERSFSWIVRQGIQHTPCLMCDGAKPRFQKKECTICAFTLAVRTLLHIARVHHCPKDIRKLLVQYLYRETSIAGYEWLYPWAYCPKWTERT